MNLLQYRLLLREAAGILHQQGIASFLTMIVPAALLPEEQQKSLAPSPGRPGSLDPDEEIKDVTLFYFTLTSEEQRSQLIEIIKGAPLKEPFVAPAADGKAG
jgi:hypothetical protein